VIQKREVTAMPKIGICGDDCDACPRYQATRSGKTGELEKVRELWERIGLRDALFPAEKLACAGCSPANSCAYPDLLKCTHNRAVENCGFCGSYPCDRLTAVFGKSERWKREIAEKATPEEYRQLSTAFCKKKDNLDGIHQSVSNTKQGNRQRPCCG
jgi:hypothetical protein